MSVKVAIPELDSTTGLCKSTAPVLSQPEALATHALISAVDEEARFPKTSNKLTLGKGKRERPVNCSHAGSLWISCQREGDCCSKYG